jgi:hypothetical protein
LISHQASSGLHPKTSSRNLSFLRFSSFISVSSVPLPSGAATVLSVPPERPPLAGAGSLATIAAAAVALSVKLVFPPAPDRTVSLSSAGVPLVPAALPLTGAGGRSGSRSSQEGSRVADRRIFPEKGNILQHFRS